MKDSRKGRRPENANAAEIVHGLDDSAWLPGWAPYLVFALLTAFLFREFIISRGLLFGTDVLALGYFARHFYAEMVRGAHVFPLWNPYVYGGLPFVDAMHGDIFYPTTVLKFIMPVHRAMGWKVVLHVFLAGVFTYGWLRHLRVSRPIATFGGVAYMLAPVLVSLIYPGHDGKLFVSALTPLALWVTDWAVVRGGASRFATLAFVVALLIYSAHTQLAYYTTWALFVLAVFRLAQAWRAEGSYRQVAQRFLAFALAGIIGAAGIGALQLWTPLRYLTKYSQRVEKSIEAEAESAYARATSWSLHPEEVFSLVVPEFVGADLQTKDGPVNTYWGRNDFKLNSEYGGLIPLLLLPLAFFSRRRRGEVWLFTGMAAAGLIYAVGATTPLFRLFYWLVPGVKLFRAPSSIMFVFAIAVITAASLGLQGLRDSQDTRDWEVGSRKSVISLWVIAALLLVLALLGSVGALTEMWTATVYRDIASAKLAALQTNTPNIERGLWLTFVLAAAVAGAWHLRSRRKIPQAGWISALIFLSCLDTLRIDPQFIQVIDVNRIYPRDDTTDFLLQQQEGGEPFRVFTLPQASVYQFNHFAFYGLEELTGHHGNELGRYMELVDFQRPGTDVFRVLRLLNVRYLVSGALIQAPGLREVYRGSRSLVYELDGAFPRAFLVENIDTVPDSLVLDRLMDPQFSPSESAILESALDSDLPRPTASTGTSQITWEGRGVNSQMLRVSTSQPALLVISDNFYPAWHATIDGDPVPLLRADYTLRAVPIPAGTHELRLAYRSSLFRAALWTTVISGLLCGLVVAGGLYGVRRNQSGESRSGERAT